MTATTRAIFAFDSFILIRLVQEEASSLILCQLKALVASFLCLSACDCYSSDTLSAFPLIVTFQVVKASLCQVFVLCNSTSSSSSRRPNTFQESRLVALRRIHSSSSFTCVRMRHVRLRSTKSRLVFNFFCSLTLLLGHKFTSCNCHALRSAPSLCLRLRW